MLIPIRNLGAGGVVTDVLPFDLALNQFSSSSNVVFRDGKAEKIPGWTEVIEVDATADAYWFHAWKDVDGSVYAVFGLDADIKLYNGAAMSNPAHPTLTATHTDWQMDQFGKFVLLNNQFDTPMYSDDSDGSSFAVLPGWTTSINAKAKVVRPFKSFLVALWVGNDPYTVYWSDESAPDAIPDDWDYTATTNLAGRNALPAADGQLVDGLTLGDAFIVYTDFAAYAMRLVANTTYVFSFTRLNARGLLNKNCVVSFETQHFCVGDQVIYIHDGSRITRIADNRVEHKFFSEIADGSKVSVAKDEANHEVLIYYPTGDDTHSSRILRWNWLENTWNFANVDDGDDEVSCIRLSLRAPVATSYQDLLDAGTTYAGLSGTTYAALSGNANDELIPHRLSVDVNTGGSTFWEMESGFTRDGAEYDAYVQKLYIDLDELTRTTERIKHISSILPQMDGSGIVQIRVGASMGVNDAITWNAPVEFDLDSDQYKVDVRISGRYLAIQIGEWTGSPTANNWRLSGLDIEVTDGGGR